MFGESIDYNEIMGGVFETNGGFSSVSLGVVLAPLVDGHLRAADQNRPMMPPEKPLRW